MSSDAAADVTSCPQCGMVFDSVESLREHLKKEEEQAVLHTNEDAAA
ncbi:hypothetical protein NTE_02138 [Candidatus Nitrososphaera evergladensis SR1]|uniref:C2H2-type domain-containing protein n=1 Tax=Candidatus Nitrososphaera evergladensis SR1 TaxID=1459636 RepID=A0A075MTV4_9ARCH|nr:hypothetical protein [Candidatus Nitrososphaera evergladensis]AIF84192.1 hypothetical protein NTE_02138 [Candidatus Nitrososphaera evergladensis SR1]